MDIQQLSTEQILLVFVVLVGLTATSIVFNWHVARDAKKNPLGPNNGTFVMVGTGYTLVGIFLICWLLFGLERAGWYTLVSLLCFAMSGVPMVIGAAHRNSDHVAEERANFDQAVLREAERIARQARESQLEQELRG